ncbi:MAG: class I SAM-dependent methyltransferase [Opitutae bacterium]|nr:class I SAM-dependent methyltransferase [Opitutae bacterium]
MPPHDSSPAESRYSDGDYLSRHPGWHREHSAWKAAQIAALLRRQNRTPRSIVEVGCGAGGILAELQRALGAGEFTGYEIAPAALELAAPLANGRLRFVLGDFLALDTPPSDLLLAIDVAEHVEDYLGFLRALRPRARAHVFHLPLDLSLLSSCQPRRLDWNFESVGHLHYFTAETALRALANAGYTVRAHTFTAVELDLPPPDAQQQRLRFLRRLGRRLSPAWTSRLLGGFSLLAYCEAAP